MKSTDNIDGALGNDATRCDLMPAKSGKGMAKTKASLPFPKSDFRHWEAKVFKPAYTGRNGSQGESPCYHVRMAYRGRRASFALGLAGQRDAAKKAKEIYLCLLAEGWDATLAKYRPDCRTAEAAAPEAPTMATVGELIAAATAVSDARAKSLWGYGAALRRIAAEIKGVAGGKKKAGPKRGGAAVWRAKLDAIPLDVLTDGAVRGWMLKRERAAGADPLAKRRARNTVNSTLRMARGLFAKKLLPLIREALASKGRLLPEPVPFATLKPFPRQSARYQSRIDPMALIDRARAFLFAFAAGLRKMEIDRLLWSQIDLTRGVVRVETTHALTLKSEDSHGSVDLDAEVVGLLRKHKATAAGAFVLPGKEPRPEGGYGQLYRADAVFERLNAWLRAQGIDDRKPLHTLRKEIGAVIASREGLFAAQAFLRHASPMTTAAHYTDKKSRISSGLGSLFAPTAARKSPRRQRGQPTGSAPE